MKYKLSIIIAAYNVARYIEKCIRSCVYQDITPDLYEIVVVNDGSTDNTSQILESLRKEIPNLKLIHQENLGLGKCRNTGLQKSNSDYIWFIDGDDYLEENCLSEIINMLEEQELDVLAMDYSLAFEENGKVSYQSNVWKDINGVISGAAFYANNYERSYTWLFIFRRALFLDNSLCFKAKINMQDSEILPKLMCYAKRVYYLNKTCYYYLQQSNSFTNTNNGEKRYNYFKSIIEVRNSLEEFSNSTAIGNQQLINGLNKKMELLHVVVFNHLLFFKYEKKWLRKILFLLRENDFFPLQTRAKGKFWLIKVGMNLSPVFAKSVFDKLRK